MLAANVAFGSLRIAIQCFDNLSAYDMSQRLFAIQSALDLEHGIRSLAANPVYVLIKVIDDTRCRQTIEPLAQEPLILLPGIRLGKGPSLEF